MLLDGEGRIARYISGFALFGGRTVLERVAELWRRRCVSGARPAVRGSRLRMEVSALEYRTKEKSEPTCRWKGVAVPEGRRLTLKGLRCSSAGDVGEEVRSPLLPPRVSAGEKDAIGRCCVERDGKASSPRVAREETRERIDGRRALRAAQYAFPADLRSPIAWSLRALALISDEEYNQCTTRNEPTPRRLYRRASSHAQSAFFRNAFICLVA